MAPCEQTEHCWQGRLLGAQSRHLRAPEPACVCPHSLGHNAAPGRDWSGTTWGHETPPQKQRVPCGLFAEANHQHHPASSSNAGSAQEALSLSQDEGICRQTLSNNLHSAGSFAISTCKYVTKALSGVRGGRGVRKTDASFSPLRRLSSENSRLAQQDQGYYGNEGRAMSDVKNAVN